MQRVPLNDGWAVRQKENPFAERFGVVADPVPVTLPHDAMIGTERSSSASAAHAFFPGGAWEYRRQLELPAEAAGSSVFLEFEGVYRDARVFVNGTLATHRPSGYSDFVVEVDHLLRVGDIQRAAGRGPQSRRQPVVCGSRHLSKRLAPSGGAGPSLARPLAGARPRHRRTGGGGGGLGAGSQRSRSMDRPRFSVPSWWTPRARWWRGTRLL